MLSSIPKSSVCISRKKFSFLCQMSPLSHLSLISLLHPIPHSLEYEQLFNLHFLLTFLYQNQLTLCVDHSNSSFIDQLCLNINKPDIRSFMFFFHNLIKHHLVNGHSHLLRIRSPQISFYLSCFCQL